MGIAEGVMAGGSLLGGVLGSRGSSKAAKAQTNIAAAQQRLAVLRSAKQGYTVNN